MARQKFFQKSTGESELFSMGNNHHGTYSEILCELCGTDHPEVDPDDPGYSTFTLLQKQGVMECCGRAVDVVYKEWGEDFTEQLLREFRDEPLDARFGFLRSQLKEAVEAWAKATQKAQSAADTVAKKLP